MKLAREDIIRVLTESKPRFAKSYGIKTLGLFGSFARDTASDSSDIDIAVEMSQPNPFFVVAMKTELEEITHCKVDMIHLRERMNPFLKKRILRDIVYV